MTKIKTRFAPSPTGHLHIGGARTALFNWLLARSQGGTFVLRIEDTDAQRSTDEFTRAILNAMTWLGLDWDEGPFHQSERKAIHLEYINKMLESGRAYYCHCSAEDLTAQREKAMAEGRKPKYNGRCRNLGLGPAPGAVVRFKGPQTGTTILDDLIKGSITFDNSELDDLVILKSDGMPTYNMAVVVDDVTMGITHIIRGDDHVNNTPRQILLYQAIDAPLPKFGHVPMILGADKSRLSKRHGATSVEAYRDMGYLPEALVNYLVRLGWSHGDEEIFSREELVEKFGLENVGRSAGVFSPEKLIWLNAHYIKESSPARLAELVAPLLEQKGYDVSDRDFLAKTIPALQPRSKTIPELAENAEFYFIEDDQLVYDAKGDNKFLTPEIKPVIEDLDQKLQQTEVLTNEILENIFKEILEAHGLKMRQIAQAVRLALTGKTASPGLFEIMEVFGKEKVKARLERVMAHIYGKDR